ncbi:N-6 DNA methylase [Tenacibaculum sp. ZS6-P6]|uniref:N-6 DNA methylase n=1 Tax=Tenacibaculum sp. ZS6-P6 TaxID=3447503 RepID=UPI003F9A8C89
MIQKDEDNEALYMETIKSYTKEELNELAKSLGALQLNVFDNPYSDILGEYFTQSITKGQNGQFFTPTHVCEMMAQMTVPNLEEEGKRILDPACGSGRMPLAAAKINHKNEFFGADNDQTCAKMATLNFFLNGLKGEVAWMNSLTMEWYGSWQINMNGLGIIPVEKEQSYIWSEAPKLKKSNINEDKQLTLFS